MRTRIERITVGYPLLNRLHGIHLINFLGWHCLVLGRLCQHGQMALNSLSWGTA